MMVLRQMGGAALLALLASGCGDNTARVTADANPPPPDGTPGVTCGAIVAPAGGTYADDCAGRGEGARCELTCAAGFTSSEPGGATCTDGSWSAPTCDLDLDLDDDGVRRYPWGPDLDDDGDGAETLALGGVDLDDGDATVQATTGTGALAAGPTVALTASAGTTDLAVGDLDNDGDLDLVATNQNSHEFQIALGNGDGTFAAATSISLAAFALALGSGDGGGTVELGDFDEDGFLDIFGARRRLFFGNGDGTFTGAPNLSIGDVNASEVVDVDGDGHLDLVGLDYGNGVVTLFGNGDGTWRDDGTPATTPVASSTSLGVGWLDGDADLDVVVSTNNNALIPALGNGDGTFALGAAVTPGYVDPVAVGDVDGDGHADAVGANPISDDLYVALGNGSGGLTADTTFTPAVEFATDVDLVDLDGDGDRDLVGTFQVGGVALGRNDGVGGVATFDVLPLAGAFASAAADFDGDGVLDLAVATFDAGVAIYLGS